MGKVRLLIDEEGRLRDQLHTQSQAEADLKAQLMRSFEGKANTKMTPEKENHLDSALKNIDNSSINVCPTCESMRDEIKELNRKLKSSQKELEMMNIRNEELLKQIRLMAISEEVSKPNPGSSHGKEGIREPSPKPHTQHSPGLNFTKQSIREPDESNFGSKYSQSKDRREELSFRAGPEVI